MQIIGISKNFVIIRFISYIHLIYPYAQLRRCPEVDNWFVLVFENYTARTVNAPSDLIGSVVIMHPLCIIITTTAILIIIIVYYVTARNEK